MRQNGSASLARAASVDFRPSRLDIDALLVGTSLALATRRAIIDALEDNELLFGCEVHSETESYAQGRIQTSELDRVIESFDEPTRTQVKSALSQVNALA